MASRRILVSPFTNEQAQNNKRKSKQRYNKKNSLDIEAVTLHADLVLLDKLVALARLLAVKQKALVTQRLLVGAHAARLNL